tara:strand:- start:1382 stop:2728 length:1347 start_codon:yes stop_codon:yes gene_type:complete
MNNKGLIFIIISILLVNCSFDNKTGIWGGGKEEKRRIAELQQKQKETISTNKIYSSENIYSQEKSLQVKISLPKPKKTLSWEMAGLNYQNFIGNIYLSGIDNIFLKKKIGKNKLSMSKITNQPLIYKNNIFISDDKGTIFNIDMNSKMNWKKNIYKKIYKKIYKNLTFAIYENKIYISDNIGFIYALSIETGNLIWIKNHGIPLKSKIKIYENKIFLINQDNRLIALNINDGSIIWNIRSISSFIKSQSLLSIAFSKNGILVAINSAGDLIKANTVNGEVVWSLNTLGSMLAHATDFFRPSDVVISDENIIFSNQESIFSYSLSNGYTNWENRISSIATPIVSGENIFFITENGYFIIMSLNNGKIISSTNILKILKERKQNTKVTGFVMGSGKIFAVTLNGYLITCSALTGQTESFKKIGSPITSSPIIYDGKLFIYTEDSRILGFQ